MQWNDYHISGDDVNIISYIIVFYSFKSFLKFAFKWKVTKVTPLAKSHHTLRFKKFNLERNFHLRKPPCLGNVHLSS